MMVGAYAIYWFMSLGAVSALAETHPLLAGLGGVLFSVILCVALGVIMDRVAYKPLRKALDIGADHRHRHFPGPADYCPTDFRQRTAAFPTIIPKITLFRLAESRYTCLRCSPWSSP